MFQAECELQPSQDHRGNTVVLVKEKAKDSEGKRSNILQNPSDPDAGYDGHKGSDYKLQLAQGYGEKNEVNLITECLPQITADSESASLIHVIKSQTERELQPANVLADIAYGGDENVTACEESCIGLISPVASKSRVQKPVPQTGTAPPGHPDGDGKPEEPKGRKEGLQERYAQHHTEAWKKKYAKRSVIEGVKRALDRVTGIKQMVVRGMQAVRMALYLKTIGWNILKVRQTCAQRGIAARKVELQAA